VYEQPLFSGQVKLAGHVVGAFGVGVGVVEASLEITATPTTLGLMTESIECRSQSREIILGLSRIERTLEVAITTHVACSIASCGCGACPNATCQRRGLRNDQHQVRDGSLEGKSCLLVSIANLRIVVSRTADLKCGPVRSERALVVLGACG
jgi:hypothetical protein